MTVIALKNINRSISTSIEQQHNHKLTPMVFLRFLYVLTYIGMGVVATYHDTPSEQGGVVRLPVYWLHRISHKYQFCQLFRMLIRKGDVLIAHLVRMAHEASHINSGNLRSLPGVRDNGEIREYVLQEWVTATIWSDLDEKCEHRDFRRAIYSMFNGRAS